MLSDVPIFCAACQVRDLCDIVTTTRQILDSLLRYRAPICVGKSTYLRQVGLLTIMGMCGCFVPAEYASFRRVMRITQFVEFITPRPCRTHDSLLSRLSNDDDMEKSLSTFANEMASCAMILGTCSNLAFRSYLHILPQALRRLDLWC